MDAFFRLIAAGPMFFVSAWLLMIFAGIVSTDVGIHPFGYVTSMVVTIGLWLTLAPAIGAVGRGPGNAKHQPGGGHLFNFPDRTVATVVPHSPGPSRWRPARSTHSSIIVV